MRSMVAESTTYPMPSRLRRAIPSRTAAARSNRPRAVTRASCTTRRSTTCAVSAGAPRTSTVHGCGV
jgi:hypothetical protein